MSSDPHPRTNCTGRRRFVSRRRFLQTMGGGLGMIALADLLRAEHGAGPHHRPTAKRVLLLFMSAGVSHVDTFDHKPALEKYAGQTLQTALGTQEEGIRDVFFRTPGKLMPSPFTFRRFGQSGRLVSDLFPHTARHVDRLTFIHSMVAQENSHGPAMYHISTGVNRNGFPSIGSWVVYGLGSETQNLPAHVVLMDRGMPPGSSANWGNGFLPARYQGVVFRGEGDPILDLSPPAGINADQQRAAYELLARMNEEHLARHPHEGELSARIGSYELAARMQLSAPEAADLSRETAAVHQLYGTDRANKRHANFSRMCLLARRMLERGVRFVTVFSGGSNNVQDNWDAHDDLVKNHTENAMSVDQPVAALLTDLSHRGLLDDTLVLWTGEFGRTPTSEGSKGRDHNISGFTLWMAGGGMKPGYSHGSTDELGFRAVEDRVEIPDLHATILHALGLDHERLTYYYNGLDRRLTGVAGKVVADVFA
jgi:hypothetical protein